MPRSSAGSHQWIWRARARAALTAGILGIATSLAMPAPAVAQQWLCITPSDCGPLVPSGDIVTFALRLEHTPTLPAAGVRVRVQTSDGILYIGGQRMTPGTGGFVDARTDARGVLSGYLQGAKPGQEIHLNAEVRRREFFPKTLRVAAPITLSYADPGFVRYAGTQSRDVSVYANNLGESACRRSIVRFAPRGGTGSVSIDSAFGEFDPRNGGVCAYSTDWRLGPEVGRQVLLARSGSGAPLQITAISRRRPALRLGLGVALRKGDVSVVENSRAGDTIRVRRETPGGYVEYDSVPRERTVTTTKGGWRPEAMPLILLDGPAPLMLNRERVRLSIGASAINFQRDFFVGIALLQLRHGVQVEDSGFDFQLGALLSRPERLKNPVLCSRDLQDDRPKEVIDVSCDTKNDLRFDGVVVTVSTDAQSLVGAVSKMLGFG